MAGSARIFNIAAGAAILVVQLGMTARADINTDAFTSGVYRQAGNLLNAPNDVPGGSASSCTTCGAFEGTFTSNGIHFLVPAPNSNPLSVFVTSGGGVPSAGLVASGVYNQPMSDAATYSTSLKVVSNAAITFLPGTYTVTHDDGVIVYIGNNLVLNSASPTSPRTDTFTIASTTTGVFTAFYEATNGNPEVLNVAFAVPEPASILLFGTVALALCGIQKRRLRKA